MLHIHTNSSTRRIPLHINDEEEDDDVETILMVAFKFRKTHKI